MWFMLAMLLSAGAWGSVVRSQDRVQEEFHQTYQFAPQGRVQLENINGSVRIVGWDRNEVKVDAVKWAYTTERLNEAQIVVDADPDNIRISTKYPDRNQTFRDDRSGRLNNPASVEYTIFVPRSARIDSVELINGGLSLEGLTNDVRASSINGKLTASGLTGEAKLSTINGTLEASFNQLDAAKSIALTSVNGSLHLTIPSDANANLRASNVHGGINNDFGLPVRKGEYVGYDLAGQLGQGATRIRLANVNGSINIRRAQDGKPLSQATNLLAMRADGRNRANQEEVTEAVREARDAQREARDMQRETARAQREVARATREIQRDVESATRAAADIGASVANSMGGNYRLVERDAKSFQVKGTPRVTVETFDGAINVRSWDKQEVSYTAVKRALGAENMQGIRLTAEQRGDEVIIRAEYDKATASRLGGTQAEVAFDVFVPRQANLHASTGDGRLFIDGVSGEVNAQTGDGAVDVRDSRGRLSVQTGDGRVRVSNFDGAATVTTGDGGINLDGRFARLTASTGDGPVSLTMPEGANATIETNAESVYNDGLATSETGDETQRVRRWRVGAGGGNLLTLKTGDGRVYLRRSGGAQ
jgi:DUF4097 and DUF4098 domain-containing protein YvlB